MQKDPELFDTGGGLKPWQGGPNPAKADPEPDGETYVRQYDRVRLSGLLAAVFNLMADGRWRTLAEIVAAIERGTEASVSARLRDLRKQKFGGWEIERKRVGAKTSGLHAYRLVGAKR